MPGPIISAARIFAHGKVRSTALVGAAAILFIATDAHAKPLGGQQVTPSAAAIAAQQAAQDAASQAARDAGNALKRATLAIQAQQASQQAARDAAKAALSAMPNPVNGLGAGRLMIGTGVVGNGGVINTDLWQGAKLPSETIEGDRTKVGIEQTQGKAILTWDTFNVGGKTDLTFDQKGNRDWVALNRVIGGTAPSQILGSIKADGSVYVINQNGIIFGGASQVNVGSLIASTANIANAQFLNGGIYSTQTGNVYTPSFTGAGTGRVLVERGAQITTHDPKSVTSGGGTVMLLGKEVENQGSVLTPLGQALLAAGDDFVIRRGYGTDANQSSTTRGSEVSVGTWNGTTFTPGGLGTVSNSGEIYAAQGDITLAGHAIRQNGVLIASTSVNTRGTIHLLNSVRDATGSIVLGSGSVTSVIPDLASAASALNSQRDALIKASDAANVLRGGAATGAFDNLSTLADRLDQSRVEIVTGGNVTFDGGSISSAQGGQIAVSAKGRIFNADGSILDVSGVRDVQLAMSANNILVNVQGNELRDSPQNRDNTYLKNADVWVDVRNLIYVPAGTGGYDSDRYYTPGGLLEVGGYLANTAHSIGEWASVGGSITLSANEVIAQKGALFDISGGSVAYAGGYIQTTNFLGRDGKLYNINGARADQTFYGLGEGYIRSNDRWGVTQVWTNPLSKGRVTTRWEDGYTVGRDAGRLNMSAPTAVFEADILADVVHGEHQFNARPSGITDGYKAAQNTVALPGILALQSYGVVDNVPTAVASATKVTFSNAPAPADRAGTSWFSSDAISSFGLGGITAWSTTSIAVQDDLSLAPGGKFDFAAPSIDVYADLTARSGSVSLGSLAGTVGLIDSNGSVHVGLHSGAMIDTRGLWTNLLTDPDADLYRLAFIDGGAVSLKLTGGDLTQTTKFGDVTLDKGSRIDASAGGAVLADGKFTGGKGGAITLATFDWTDSSHKSSVIAASLTLDGTLASYGFSKGGALTVRTDAPVVIGQQTVDLSSGQLPAGVAAPYDLTLTQDYNVAAGEPLPVQMSRYFAPGASLLDQPMPASNASALLTAWSGFFANNQTVGAWNDIPVAMTYRSGGNTVSVPKGGTIPAGVNLVSIDTAGLAAMPIVQFPSGVFASLKDQFSSFTVTYAVGSVYSVDVSVSAGTLLPTGTALQSVASVQKPLSLDPALFGSGFSSYAIDGGHGVFVSDQTKVDVTMPVYQLSAAAYGLATGGDIARATDLVLPQPYLENPSKGVLTHRAGASLSLGGSKVMVGRGASLTVDPTQSIRLTASNSIVVDGDLVAHGGTIALLPDLRAPSSSYENGVLWIGEDALLDVSGEAATAVDSWGLRYGFAQAGGKLLIGLESNVSKVDAAGNWSMLNAMSAPVVIRPGARLLANGAAATIDVRHGGGLSGATPVALAGEGGLIRIGSTKSIFNDGTMEARSGGASAAGGTLNVVLESMLVAGQQTLVLDPRSRVVTVTQNRVGSGAGADLTVADAGSLAVGEARLSAAEIASGGYGSLDLWSRNKFSFDGDVSLNLPKSLSLHRGMLTHTEAASSVVLSAPYVLLDGAASIKDASVVNWDVGALNAGSLNISAALIDVANSVHFGASSSFGEVQDLGFAHVTLTSSGDVRFAGSKLLRDTSLDPTDPASYTNLPAGLYSGGAHFTITASQLYPVSGGVGVIQVGPNRNPQPGNPDWTLTINGLGNNPAVPHSVFGSLSLNAPTVRQNGIVRAPLGTINFGKSNYSYYDSVDGVTKQYVSKVMLGAGSITSVSAEGVVMPFGGTSDGLSWFYNKQAVSFADLAKFTGGVNFSSSTLTAEPGALIDVSGGGALTGAGFISGRGGSVDVLRTALVNANPANTYSAASAQVYALVPGYASGYAPVAADAAMPAIGQQITLDQAVGGLAAGTYTLMPATYALLPGAYRIELGATTTLPQYVVRLDNGSYVATGRLGTANTGLRASLPTQGTITPATSVRSYSQYNETSYSQFAIAHAAAFGAVTPRLERDASSISIDFGPSTGSVLDFRGSADLTADKGGQAGALFVTTSSRLGAATAIEVRSAGSDVTAGMASVTAEDLSRFNAGTLTVGGSYGLQNVVNNQATGPTQFGPQVVLTAASDSTVLRAGAVLQAGQVFLLAKDSVSVETGATIDTRAGATNLLDSSLGYVFNVSSPTNGRGSSAALAVGNGRLSFLGATSGSSPSNISVADGASLLTRGTIALSSSGAQTLGDVKLAARYLALSTTVFNIGSAQSIADGGSTGGINLTQQLLDRLLGSDTPLEQLALSASQSINMYGNARLDLTAHGGVARTLVLDTPALYGWGNDADNAAIVADKVVWSGVVSGVGVPGSPYVSATPGAVAAGGAGTGEGSLTINARNIVFGYALGARSQDQTTLDRLTLGFSTVNLVASDSITANNRNSLSVYASGPNPGSGFDAKSYAGSGGALNLVTPLLTGEAGSSMTYRTGGSLAVSAPTMGAAATASVTTLGAEIKLFGNRVSVDTAVALPSGRLSIAADNGIVLDSRAAIDLAGRAVRFFDVTKYSWGGDLLLGTTDGGVTQAVTSSIDVSAAGARAGSIKATATGVGGTVDFAGSLAGAGGQGFASGSIDLRVTSLADFTAFNEKLSAAGFFEGRSFAIKTGDLVIGDEVRAKSVAISVDGGSLTVNGRINASGTTVGSISLAAPDDLTLASTAVLDVHGTMLAVDGRGALIEASNRGHIELTSREGTLRLNSGATLDLSTPSGRYGQVVLNAPRTGETSGDIKVDAAGSLAIKGAASIALNAFWTYTLPGGSVISQTMLDGYDAANTSFINAALGNSALQTRIAGLTDHGDSFHLRPGVEIAATGDLSTSGDLDLSGYRYGANADRDAHSATYGAGEPMALLIRSAGTLTVKGSISDGFAGTPGIPGTPNTYDGVVDIPTTFESDGAGGYYSFDYDTEYYIGSDWIVPNTPSYEFGLYLGGGSYNPGDTIKAGTKFYLGELYIDSGITLPVIAASFTAGIPDIPGQSGASAGAVMQAPGTRSASLRLVAGADLASADQRTLTAASALRAIGAGYGSLVLDAPITTDASTGNEVASVVRTGTGSLDLLAGADFRQNSLYGIYTAGAQVADTDAYNNTVSDNQRMYFTNHGGDLSLTAQGDLRSYGIEYSDIGSNSSAPTNWLRRQGNSSTGEAIAWGIYFGGFSGIGTVGGGNVHITAGGDAGSTSNWNVKDNSTAHADDSFNLVVASSGYVADGTLTQFGGGTLKLDVGGRINTGVYTSGTLADSLGVGTGAVINLRGDSVIEAGSIGQLLSSGYGLRNAGAPLAPYDPRAIDTTRPRDRTFYTPLRLVTGDGVTTLHSRGNAGVLTATDPSPDAVSLWTDRSGYSLFSAGGNVSQLPVADAGSANSEQLAFDPASFAAIAPSGSITVALKLSPNRTGSLELLAGDSLFGKAIMSSGTTATNLHAGDPDPIRLYAVAGDVMLTTGDYSSNINFPAQSQLLAAKPVVMRAGRDILTNAYILNNDDNDVSVISAGRDILNSVIGIWGPGLLDISAGRNIYQSGEGDQYLNDRGSITSYGAISAADARAGASIVMTAGVGATGPDYASLAKLYLDPSNQAVTGTPLAEQPDKVAKTYRDELVAWLKERFGYAAKDDADARAYFAALAPEQQAILLRQVYFAELKAGGREYNDPKSARYGSYLRGRRAIAALFPAERSYDGDITVLSAANTLSFVRPGGGIRTLFGGDIQMLTPGGQQVLGVEGIAPPSSAGIVTQGTGDIEIYSEGSILLGLSRIMTTFGGDILAWSAEGDINAGRGAKTTIVYTPAKRVYDDYGNVALAPNVPSSGAGIASRSSIPGIPGGSIDLIAPLGTIDAGEAGIRAGADVNLAALHIVNAANIQAQGNVSGVPQVQAPNIGGLTEATNASSASQAATKPEQQGTAQQASVIIVEVIGFGGSDGEDGDPERQKRRERQGSLKYDPDSPVRVVGNGPMSTLQADVLTEDERRLLAAAERSRH